MWKEFSGVWMDREGARACKKPSQHRTPSQQASSAAAGTTSTLLPATHPRTVTDCMCRVCYSGNAIHGLWRWRCFFPHQSTTWRALRHFPLSSEASGAALPSRLADSFHSPTFYFTLLPSSSSLAHSHLHYQPPPFHRHDQGIKKSIQECIQLQNFSQWPGLTNQRKKKKEVKTRTQQISKFTQNAETLALSLGQVRARNINVDIFSLTNWPFSTLSPWKCPGPCEDWKASLVPTPGPRHDEMESLDEGVREGRLSLGPILLPQVILMIILQELDCTLAVTCL